MYLRWNASKARIREAEDARDNRLDLRRSVFLGQITRRDVVRMGLITAGGLWVAKHGLSPFAKSAYAAVRTGVPRSPLGAIVPRFGFTQPLLRLNPLTPIPLSPVALGGGEVGVAPASGLGGAAGALAGRWGPVARRMANTDRILHTVKLATGTESGPWGPTEGRPPGEFYAHQRWNEFLPGVGFLVSLGQIRDGTRFHPAGALQNPNSVWAFGQGRFVRGMLPPPLIRARYGEPILFRHYNNLPFQRSQNGGFGLNESATHNHNAHNGAESDGAQNAHFFSGEFYDYHWSTAVARHDMYNRSATDKRCSGPDGRGGCAEVPGDYRELQSTLWFHDHRFFFTSENVYKGHAGMLNLSSGPDRGNETLDDGINLRLPSGSARDWGNLDFDVNLLIADFATDRSDQLFFDIFDTDGFLGDMIHVNYAYKPFFEVLPRKYRFRILSAGMSRWIDLVLADSSGRGVPVQMIANDGNLFPHPVTVTSLGKQGTAERFDIIVDFSRFKVGDQLHLVNLLQFSNGRKPDGIVSLADALSGKSPDPAVGPILQFRVVGSVRSVDDPSRTLRATDRDWSRVPNRLTEQIPIVTPVRERVIEFVRSGDTDAGLPFDPEPNTLKQPWAIKVNGEDAHHLDARRISNLIPRPGEVEHWTLLNGGGGWDHPIHLHFEEGVTMNRGDDRIPATERLKRKDVWRLNPSGEVQFQVRFGEFGGAYVNHCHNTVHEDSAMLLRYDVLSDKPGDVHVTVLPTPDPRPEGVTYVQSCFLEEGNPANVNPGASECPSEAIGPVVPFSGSSTP